MVGLGNPGPEYERTRHNAGFWFCDALAHLKSLSFHHESRFHGWVAATHGAERYALLKPDTFMNRSGQSVGAYLRFYRLSLADILVIHDELDLPPGQLRLKRGGGSGGHNGLKDITAHLGSADYWRLRVGIGHPGCRTEVIHHVLKPPSHDESQMIEQALNRALAAWPMIAQGQWDKATQKINTKPVKKPA
jgi:peptidyl-tRNA hydrolase, PTH1 family